MRLPISKSVRLLVAQRADFRCEYCLLREEDSFLSFEIDHIVSVKHGDGNEPENLAYACPHCNTNKGSDLVTVVDSYDDLVRLYNPRTQVWNHHFRALDGEIIAETRIGQATINLLRMNQPDRLIIRRLLAQAERYP